MGGESWYDTCDGVYVSRNLSPYIPYRKKYYITPHSIRKSFFRIVPEVCFVKLYIFLGQREI